MSMKKRLVAVALICICCVALFLGAGWAQAGEDEPFVGLLGAASGKTESAETMQTGAETMQAGADDTATQGTSSSAQEAQTLEVSDVPATTQSTDTLATTQSADESAIAQSADATASEDAATADATAVTLQSTVEPASTTTTQDLKTGDTFTAVNDEGRGIVYTITSSSTVAVGGSAIDQGHTVDFAYTGALSIPETVRYKGTMYTVTEIKDYAFAPYTEYYSKVTCKISSITIASSVTTIGAFAFQEMPYLDSFTFEDGSTLASIGDGAFYGCARLATMRIPASVSELGSEAFSNTGLESIVFEGDKVSYFPYRLFASTSLENIDFIPASVTTFANEVFAGSDLRSATIPTTVTSLGTATFKGCENLAFATFAEGSPLTEIPAYTFDSCTSLKSYTIQSFFTSVETGAFQKSGLTSINIPTTLTYLGDATFRGCKNLDLVTFAKGHALLNVSERLFQDCTSLTSIDLPDNVRSLGQYAFAGCTSLTSFYVPLSTTSLGAFAFQGCTALETLVFRADATYVSCETSTFFRANALKSVVFYGKRATSLSFYSACPTYYYTISYYDSVADATSATNCRARYAVAANVVPATATADEIYEGSYTTSPAGGGAWGYEEGFDPTAEITDSFYAYSTEALRELEVGDTFTYSTKEGVSVTYTVETLPQGETLGKAHVGYENLLSMESAIDTSTTGSVTIPERVVGADGKTYEVDGIGAYAFLSCSRIATVTIPDTVKSIGTRAFARCSTLRNIYFEGDASSILDAGIFTGCSNIRRVVFGGKKANLSFGASAPDVYYTVFYYESKHDLDIDNRLSTLVVHERALLDSLDATEVSSGSIPALRVGYEWVYEDGFSGTTPLSDSTSVYAAGIGFQVDIEVRSGNVSQTACWFKVLSLDETTKKGTVQVGLGKDGICAIHTATSGVPVIPSTVQDSDGNTYDVVEVSPYAFGSTNYYTACTYITSVVLPQSITSIGKYAFASCQDFISVSLTKNLATLGESAFENCTGLSAVQFRNACPLTTVSDRAFYGCYNLSNVTLPSNLNTIGTEAFANCYYYDTETKISSGLRNVTIPKSVQTISARAFKDDKLLTTCKLPESLMYVGEQAYFECISISEIRFVGNAKNVEFGENCFYFGTGSSLKSLVFEDKKSTSVKKYITAMTSKGFVIDYGVYYTVKFYSSQEDFAVKNLLGKMIVKDDVAPRYAEIMGGLYEGSIPSTSAGMTWSCEDGFSLSERSTDSFYAVMGRDISAATVVLSQTEYYYTGDFYTPTVRLFWTDGTELVYGRDFTTDKTKGFRRDGYVNNRTGPDAAVYLVGIGEYAGSAKGTFTVSLAVDTSSSFSVSLADALEVFAYDGQAKTPEVNITAMLMGEPYDAIEGIDYTISYEDNVNAGVARVVVTGLGIFGGSQQCSFIIHPASILDCDVTGVLEKYELPTGGGITPKLTITSAWGATLVESVDFSYTILGGSSAGVAQIFVQGMGNYGDILSLATEVSSGSGGGGGGGIGTGLGSGSADESNVGSASGAGSASVALSPTSSSTQVQGADFSQENSTDAASVAAEAGGGNGGDRRVYAVSDKLIDVVETVVEAAPYVLLIIIVVAGALVAGMIYRKKRYDHDV